MISVIFPVKNEEANVEELHKRIKSALDSSGEAYEIIAVDDGSTDQTLKKLSKLSPLKTVVLFRNYGQSLALDAGLREVKGDIVVTIDADLQNDPADIPNLVKKINEGYDVVVGWRQDRQDPFVRRFFSRMANWITRSIAGLDIHDYGCALRAFRKEYINSLRLYGVMHVFIPVILKSHGARVAELSVKHRERTRGISKYSILHIATDFADLLTIKFLYGYAARPLLFFGIWSIVSFGIAFLAVVASVIIKFQDILGFSQTPLPIIATLFIILGVLLLTIGFLTELLIRIYYESRRETPYRVKEVIENK